MDNPKSESGYCTDLAPQRVLTLEMLCKILVVGLERR